MVQDGASQEMLICAFKEAPSLPWQHVQSTNIVKVVKDAIPAVRLGSACFENLEVGSHSL